MRSRVCGVCVVVGVGVGGEGEGGPGRLLRTLLNFGEDVLSLCV